MIKNIYYFLGLWLFAIISIESSNKDTENFSDIEFVVIASTETENNKNLDNDAHGLKKDIEQLVKALSNDNQQNTNSILSRGITASSSLAMLYRILNPQKIGILPWISSFIFKTSVSVGYYPMLEIALSVTSLLHSYASKSNKNKRQQKIITTITKLVQHNFPIDDETKNKLHKKIVKEIKAEQENCSKSENSYRWISALNFFAISYLNTSILNAPIFLPRSILDFFKPFLSLETFSKLFNSSLAGTGFIDNIISNENNNKYNIQKINQEIETFLNQLKIQTQEENSLVLADQK